MITTLRRYSTIVSIWWQRGLAYRMTILGYRAGEIFEMLVLILMWSRIFIGRDVINGYTKEEMITYVLMGSLFSVIVRSFARDRIATEIENGQLSAFITKPMNYLTYAWMREFGRASLPTMVSITSGVIVILFFHNTLIVNTNIAQLLIIAAMLMLAFVTEQLIAFLIGFTAFWTEKTDAAFDSVSKIKRFFSGGYFPLSLLPPALAAASFWLPFSYAFYVPAQLYLGKITIAFALRGLLIQLGWIILLYILVRVVYKRGLKKYEGTGI